MDQELAEMQEKQTNLPAQLIILDEVLIEQAIASEHLGEFHLASPEVGRYQNEMARGKVVVVANLGEFVKVPS